MAALQVGINLFKLSVLDSLLISRNKCGRCSQERLGRDWRRSILLSFGPLVKKIIGKFQLFGCQNWEYLSNLNSELGWKARGLSKGVSKGATSAGKTSSRLFPGYC